MKKLLIIGSVWPEPASSAAGSRMVQLLDLFTKGGCSITFASTANKSPYSEALQNTITEKQIFLNDPSFDAFIKDLQPDIVLFDRFMTEEQFGWRVREQSPDCLLILDTEDLHFLREARGNAVKQSRAVSYSDYNSTTAHRELATILRCDVSLIISEAEVALLRELNIQMELLFYLPLFSNELTELKLSFAERKHFITIGNFLHAPNKDAVIFLKEKIWPLISTKIPGAEMHVYGAYPTAKELSLTNTVEHFFVFGRAENASTVLSEARVCLAPLRFGAGLKGKLLEAMNVGTPSVTTKIGAEGMNGNLSWPGSVNDDAEEFANAAIELYTNESRWNKASAACLPLLRERFDRKLFADNFITRVFHLIENLQPHRQKNIIGNMLRSQQFQASRYLSLWIEEKNKSRSPQSIN